MLPKHWTDQLADAIKDFLLDMEFTEEEEDAAWPEDRAEIDARSPSPQGRWAERYRRMFEDR